jgi:hypothetical protein
VKLGVRDIDPFMHAKLIQVSSVRGIQSAAAIVFGVGVVVSDAFAAQVEIGTLDAPRNDLRTAGIDLILKRGSAVWPWLVFAKQTTEETTTQGD